MIEAGLLHDIDKLGVFNLVLIRRKKNPGTRKFLPEKDLRRSRQTTHLFTVSGRNLYQIKHKQKEDTHPPALSLTIFTDSGKE